MEYSSRLIHFYELNLPHKDGHNQEQTLRDVITNIIELNKNKSKERLLNGIDQYTCTRDVIFRTDSKIIQSGVIA